MITVILGSVGVGIAGGVLGVLILYIFYSAKKPRWFPFPHLLKITDETLQMIQPPRPEQIHAALKKAVLMIKRAEERGVFTEPEKRYVCSVFRQATRQATAGLSNNPDYAGDILLKKMKSKWELLKLDPELRL